MSRRCKILILLTCFLASAAYLYAGGLSSYFVETKLENLKPGRSYSIKKITGKSVVVINTTDNITVDLAIEAEKPVDYNLVKGYEPIPSISWVKIKKNHFKNVRPQQSIETDIIINIPPNKKYCDKKYQVYIYTHTVGEGTFRVGLMGRVLFSTAAYGKK